MGIVFRRLMGAICLLLFVTLGLAHLFWPHFTISNGSMRPTIAVGSEVVLVTSDQYKPGDIVTVKDGNTYMTHRLMGFDPDGALITKGDANQDQDPIRLDANGQPNPLTTSDIQGRVLFDLLYYDLFLVFWMLVLAGLGIWGLLSQPKVAAVHPQPEIMHGTY